MSTNRRNVRSGVAGVALTLALVAASYGGRVSSPPPALAAGKVLSEQAMGQIFGDAPAIRCVSEKNCAVFQSYGTSECYYCKGDTPQKRFICCPTDNVLLKCSYTGGSVCDGAKRFVGTPGGTADSCGLYPTCGGAQYVEPCGGTTDIQAVGNGGC